MSITLDNTYGGTQLEIDAKRNRFLDEQNALLRKQIKLLERDEISVTVNGDKALKFLEYEKDKKIIRDSIVKVHDMLNKHFSDVSQYDFDRLVGREFFIRLMDEIHKIENLAK